MDIDGYIFHRTVFDAIFHSGISPSTGQHRNIYPLNRPVHRPVASGYGITVFC
jgi:hypothetical protein